MDWYEKLVWGSVVFIVILAMILGLIVYQFEQRNPINPEAVRLQIIKGDR